MSTKQLQFLLSSLLMNMIFWGARAQESALVTIIHDGHSQDINLTVEQEIRALLDDEMTLQIDQITLSEVVNPAHLSTVYQKSDVVIGASYGASILLGARDSYPKPTIISLVFDHELQGIPLAAHGKSGIPNLTYVQSPFDLSRDFDVLREIVSYKRLAVVMDDDLVGRERAIRNFLRGVIPDDSEFELVLIADQSSESLNRLEGYDAVYFLPIDESTLSDQGMREVYQGLANQGVVTFSMFSTPAIDQGAYASYVTDANVERIPRRVALSTMKILEGQKPEDLSVIMTSYTEDLIINMEAVNRSGVYPSYDVLQKAIVENIVFEGTSSDVLTLQQAIAEGLQNNLQLAVAKKDVEIGNSDIGIAKSNILPQVDLSATAYTLDELRVQFQGRGTLGYLNMNAQAKLTQVILSEPAMANIAIQKLLKESKEYALEKNELDVVQNIINAYLGILQTKTLVELNNDNLTVSRQNFNIAKNRQQVGQGGASDVYRWQSQLALQNVEVNNSLAQLRQARHGLAFLLNRDYEQLDQVDDVDLLSLGVISEDDRLLRFIKSPNDFQRLANFMVEEANANLPELKEIQAALKAQERNLESQKKAFYLPQIALQADYTQPLGHYYVPKSVMKIDDVPSQYQVALALQMPIFQGNKRRHQQAKTEVEVLKLEDNLNLLKSNLEMNLRNNMAVTNASYNNMQLTREAATAAAQNFEIAQNSYREGLLNITSLIDAQNALLQTNINATNAEYTFIRDIIAMERSTGQFTFFASPAEKEAYFQRFVEFMSTKK